MGFIQVLKEIVSSKRPTEPDAIPSAYPPVIIDYTKWERPSPADSRSPCPMVNALCNHHILPHDGRQITKAMAVNALVQAINLDPQIASVFASHAVHMNPDKTADNFDLNHLSMHGDIEHDVSLSRNDAGFGDNHSFDKEVWAKVIETYGAATETSFASASKARYGRVKASKKAHEEAGLPFQYGLKELVLSYGESALTLGTLGSPEEGKIPLEYVKVLFEQGRIPYNEGWRKSGRPITQNDMNHMIKSLMMANEEKADEAHTVELGTVQAVQSAVHSLMPTMCNVM